MHNRKALVVGIDYYTSVANLHGCVNDALAVQKILESHSDGSLNFDIMPLTATGPENSVSRAALKDCIQNLFADDYEIALFYFAGHGHIEMTGGYLGSSDCQRGDDGLPLSEVLSIANNSKARHKIIVLDACHAGFAGNLPGQQTAELSVGMTILAASTAEQYASEENGSGVFTALFVDALNGAAANIVGAITPGSVYAHIDQSLGAWRQRPVFKTNVKGFVSLREVEAPIALTELRQITTLFPTSDFELPLDPSFEPELTGRPEGSLPPNPVNTAKFAILQHYHRVNLVRPVNAPHMWHAAIESKACKLTVLGKHYHRLIQDKRI
jgi:hypothetical protein